MITYLLTAGIEGLKVGIRFGKAAVKERHIDEDLVELCQGGWDKFRPVVSGRTRSGQKWSWELRGNQLTQVCVSVSVCVSVCVCIDQ